MKLTPGYGETPVSDEGAAGLLPQVRELLGEPVSKAAVYDLEQAVQEKTTEELSLYGDIWTWAGVFRKREVNIGVAPEQIAVELHATLEAIR